MFAPLRSVFAGQLMVCNMKTSSTNASSVVVDAALSAKHCLNMMDGATVDDRVESQNNYSMKSCCDDGACSSDCHVAAFVSLLMQAVDYSPTLLKAATFNMISSTLLVRELIPPSRPPLSLYS